MKRHVRRFIFLSILAFMIGLTVFGKSNDKPPEPPQLIQDLLEKERATLDELKTDRSLRETLKHQLYEKIGKPAPQRRIQRMPHRTFVKLPPYCQLIVDHNIFRPLGYRKYEWTLKLELIGTMVYADSAKNTAILKSNHPKYRRLIVKTGDTFLESLIVTRIAARQMIYTDENGKQKHLTLPSLFGSGPENLEREAPYETFH